MNKLGYCVFPVAGNPDKNVHKRSLSRPGKLVALRSSDGNQRSVTHRGIFDDKPEPNTMHDAQRDIGQSSAFRNAGLLGTSVKRETLMCTPTRNRLVTSRGGRQRTCSRNAVHDRRESINSTVDKPHRRLKFSHTVEERERTGKQKKERTGARDR